MTVSREELSTVSTVTRHICAKHRITPSALSGRCRSGIFVAARKEFAKTMRDMGYSLKEIARELHRDHTTIIHYLREKSE